jgi:hypothetical protein
LIKNKISTETFFSSWQPSGGIYPVIYSDVINAVFH